MNTQTNTTTATDSAHAGLTAEERIKAEDAEHAASDEFATELADLQTALTEAEADVERAEKVQADAEAAHRAAKEAAQAAMSVVNVNPSEANELACNLAGAESRYRRKLVHVEMRHAGHLAGICARAEKSLEDGRRQRSAGALVERTAEAHQTARCRTVDSKGATNGTVRCRTSGAARCRNSKEAARDGD